MVWFFFFPLRVCPSLAQRARDLTGVLLGWSTEGINREMLLLWKQADPVPPSPNPANSEHIFSQMMSVEKICTTLPLDWDTKKAVSINTHTQTHTRIQDSFFPLPFFPNLFFFFFSSYFNKGFLLCRSTFYSGADNASQENWLGSKEIPAEPWIPSPALPCWAPPPQPQSGGKRALSLPRGCWTGDLLWHRQPATRRGQNPPHTHMGWAKPNRIPPSFSLPISQDLGASPGLCQQQCWLRLTFQAEHTEGSWSLCVHHQTWALPLASALSDFPESWTNSALLKPDRSDSQGLVL